MNKPSLLKLSSIGLMLLAIVSLSWFYTHSRHVTSKQLCNLSSGKCQVNLHGIEFEIDVLSRPVLPETENTFIINASTPIESISGEVSGLTMNMGYIPLRWTKQGEQWQGRFMLVSCTEPNMDWLVTYTFKTAQGEFHFTTMMSPYRKIGK